MSGVHAAAGREAVPLRAARGGRVMPERAGLVTRVEVRRRGGHDVVRVWNRHGLAGELTVIGGDGLAIAEMLVPGDRTCSPGQDGEWTLTAGTEGEGDE